MNRQDILTLFDYNAWANTRVLGAVESLSAEQFLRSRFFLDRAAGTGTRA